MQCDFDSKMVCNKSITKWNFNESMFYASFVFEMANVCKSSSAKHEY